MWTRMWVALALLATLVVVMPISLSNALVPVHAAALRTAGVGDRIGRLTVGLHAVRSGNIDRLHCHDVAIYGTEVYWLVAGRVDPIDASTVTLEFDGRPRLAVTYDEADLQQDAAVYAADTSGVIRYVASGDVDKDRVCAVLRDLWEKI